MQQQLEILLQIQDLKSQRKELAEGEVERQVEAEEFHVDIASALDQLDGKIDEMVAELKPAIRSRYQRLEGRGRVVVPVINGICYGCFVAVPTARSAASSTDQALHSCENCGRFLYVTY
jgi:predicted  nucleic acid-binding Zn-ribbon protein